MFKPAKLWRFFTDRPDLTETISKALGISPIVAKVMVNRGITSPAEAKTFLFGSSEVLADPCLMSGMDRAVERIKYAISERQKIVIYGDYDVDGVTATALVYRVLSRLGAVVDYYVPERQTEGYGLNNVALENIYQSGTCLVVTVDCGISASAEVANMAGRLDIIITDHHQPPEVLPSALAILNPKLSDDVYPDKNLAGVGVAFKLCQALWQSINGTTEVFMDYLDLVAVGTIADVAPIIGENRILVKLGLDKLALSPNLGLKALSSVCGLKPPDIDAGKVGFVIGPRLNAAGRVSHAAIGVELLITEDIQQASEIATDLENENSCRQMVEKEVLAEAEAKLAAIDLKNEKVLVLAEEGWHSGVIGIVASRLVEKFYRPVVMISIQDGIGKGSCRSIPGFNIYQALKECDDLLLRYGGHAQAAGLSVDESAIELLRERLNGVAADWLSEEDYHQVIKVDACVALADISSVFLEQLACLEPHGIGNPSPVFMTEDLAVADAKAIGREGRHLKLRVKGEQVAVDVVAWNMGDLAAELEIGDCVDLAFLPEYNEWQGRRKLQLKARDILMKNSMPNHVSLIDARDVSNKTAYCIEVIKASKQTIVVTDSRRQAVQLSRDLRLLLPDDRRQIYYYHDLMTDNMKKRIISRWQTGEFGILIWSGEEIPGGAAEYILYNVPSSRHIFNRLCAGFFQGQCPVRMHFLFGAANAKALTSELTTLFPDRLAVGRVYLFLKGTVQCGQSPFLTAEKIAAIISERGQGKLAPSAVAAALKILEELALLRRNETVLSQKIELLPEPKEKLDIEASLTYRKEMVARRERQQFAEEMAYMPLEKLWRQAIEFTGGLSHGMEEFD
ncbi:MAG: single-stranded-DNA-specific exonuclease RecJ [Firmicutes bacterium]|nr:single-stranded-DNA-specific exonuclease RecJ [Bacillota bacterium]